MTDTLDISRVKHVGKTYWTRDRAKKVKVKGVNAAGLLKCSDGHLRSPYGRYVFDGKETILDLIDEVEALPEPIETWGNWYPSGSFRFYDSRSLAEEARCSGGKTCRVRIEFLEEVR